LHHARRHAVRVREAERRQRRPLHVRGDVRQRAWRVQARRGEAAPRDPQAGSRRDRGEVRRQRERGLRVPRRLGLLGRGDPRDARLRRHQDERRHRHAVRVHTPRGGPHAEELRRRAEGRRRSRREEAVRPARLAVRRTQGHGAAHRRSLPRAPLGRPHARPRLRSRGRVSASRRTRPAGGPESTRPTTYDGGMDWDLSSYFPEFDGPAYRAFVATLNAETRATLERAQALASCDDANLAARAAVRVDYERLGADRSQWRSYLRALSAVGGTDERFRRPEGPASLAAIARQT